MRLWSLLALGAVLVGCGFSPVKGPISGKTYMAGFLPEEYWDECRQHYVNQNPGLETRFREAILQRQIVLGMSAEMAHVAWALSRVPGGLLDVNRTVTPSTVREQWVVGARGRESYLYFENGFLTSWQQ